MHCPQCGQQQASAEMRFCSRCGFPLGGVVELLAGGGLPKSNDEQPQGHMISPRRKGVTQGVLMMMLGAVVVPVLGVLSTYIHSPKIELLTALSAVIFFVGGFVRILYALLFEQGKKSGVLVPATSDPPVELNAGTPISALPPAQSIPVTAFAQRRANTAELVQPPPSVTENTTRLLDEEKAAGNE